MRAVVDTSSLLALVRYYLPFDSNNSLKKLIQLKIESKEIIVLDKVVEESKYVSQGIILESLEFLKQKNYQIKTTEILPYPKFFNLIENQFCIQVQRKKMSDVEFDSRKKDFLDSADSKLLLFCLKEKNDLPLDNPFVVSEETNAENDGKVFKKLPSLCSLIDVEHKSLTEFFKNHLKISLTDYLK